MKSPLMRLVALAALATALSGCASAPAPEVSQSAAGPFTVSSLDDVSLVTYAAPRQEGADALLEGELALTEGGCFGVVTETATTFVVFPSTATLTADGAVAIGDRTLRLGDTFSVGGGSIPTLQELQTVCPDTEDMFLSIQITD